MIEFKATNIWKRTGIAPWFIDIQFLEFVFFFPKYKEKLFMRIKVFNFSFSLTWTK